SEAPVAVPSGTAAETPAPAEARPESSLKPAFETEPEPFLLHKAAETHPEQPAEEKKPAASEPVPAEPSMPLISPKFQETNSKQTPEPGVRVVNYSEFKTEVEPGSQVSKEPTNINPQNTLDLRKTDQTSKPETTKNTINLKDLPVE
ncbi:MAG: hypothetical protein M1153_00235, partial [Patescibacteria group bacterium]|nr:hypothetical protein [Patescibacteria group bacterium]